MNQGLLNWLNAVNHNDNDAGQTKTGLLLAPINIRQQDNHEELNLIHEINEPVYDYESQNEYMPDEHEDDSLEIDIPIQIYEPEQQEQQEQQEQPEQKEESHEPEQEYQHEHQHQELEHQEHEPEHEHQEQQDNEPIAINKLIGIPEDIQNNHDITEVEVIARELENLKNEVDSMSALQQQTAHTLDLNKAWHEANAGLELSMKEPPPQIWTTQNESESESEDEESDNESEDHEHIILQQNSSITLHGTNFTQRLQHILQGRKNKAAELKRKSSENNRHSHPYIRHALMMCGAMILTLGLVWLSIRYLQTKTPESFSHRASELYEQGKYDEAMNLYQEAYNIYPKDITFLEGIARSAERAGHVQTASIAWNEYRNSHHEDVSNDPEPLEININTGGGKQESGTESKSESKREVKTESRESVLTFNEYLNEANRLYNIGMYSKALEKFIKALEQRNDDIRPYIGIAQSYRAKGMYLDALHILNEARRIFGINPTIEMLKKILRESKE